MLKRYDRASPTRARLLRRLAVLSATASVLFPTPVEAQERPTAGGGIFVGYAFGARTGLEWGFEAFITDRRDADLPNLRSGFGPLAQFGLIGLGEPRITLALMAGSELTR